MNKFIMSGLLINAVCIIVNRFVTRIPNMLAIPVMLIDIACLLMGLVQMKQHSQHG